MSQTFPSDFQLPQSMSHWFLQRVRESGERVAIRFFADDTDESKAEGIAQQSKTWCQLAGDVLDRTRWLLENDVLPGEHVGQCGENSYDWIVNDLAIQFCGAVHVPFHAKMAQPQLQRLCEHGEIKRLLVPNAGSRSRPSQGEGCAECNSPLGESRAPARRGGGDPPRLRRPFQGEGCFCGSPPRPLVPRSRPSQGEGCAAEALEELLVQHELNHNSLISILYTSGTTGSPKGVMLSQKNVMANVLSKLQTLPLGPDDIRLGILPFSHIFARVCDIYTWIVAGCEMVLSRGREYWLDDLRIVAPTYLNAVPYLYEKIFHTCRGDQARPPTGSLAAALGGRVEIANCGGAAIRDDVFEAFRADGVCLVTGYGLTETSPVLTSCRPDAVAVGSVGQAVPGVALKIADDGEVLAAGDNVMQGYYKNPEATQKVFADGWFRTGDLGRVDENGFLFLVGRKKEILVTSGGKNIAPATIESLLNDSPLIEQSMVIGDAKKFLAALIVPSSRILKVCSDLAQVDSIAFSQPSHREGRARQRPGRAAPEITPEIMNDQLLRKTIQGEIDRRLQDVSHDEQIRQFILLPEPFSIENGQLTEKSSLRRSVVLQRYSAEIEAIYGE